ncbi:MAG: 5'-methylthioadenosine/S-adenosylhomocysteine nucleosidase [Muribaculaceae bacterium]|nr:5'-methylthioadenosine/S-adenosylhomocysteine nucleosidase [Muribaculaceae bacterium]MDE6322136.1 5'-methylthioadenosine/S-adenosylhomocysteine nucleosidase [Muribaculaceae bacterium]
MNKELQLLLNLINDPVQVEHDGFKFTTGVIGDCKVVAMQCGIGKVNAALGATAMINNFQPSLIINTGVAGGTGHTHPLDVVIADSIAYHDTYCGPGTDWGEMADCPRYFKPTSEILSKASEAVPDAKTGLVASGDFFVSTPAEVDRIVTLHPQVIAVDMESAAIAHACFKRDIPFLCVRVISDTPGQTDNLAQYENFWDDAPRNTFRALTHIIEAL